MRAKGTNLRERQNRLTVAFCDAGSELQNAKELGDTDTVTKLRARMRLIRLAWQRLDDQRYPKGR